MLFPKLKICLASTSPRRRELLRQLGLDFEIQAPEVPERARPGEPPREFARRMAAEKAGTVFARLRQHGRPPPVLGADTVVVLAGEMLGKPRDREHGEAMLRRLSGNTHEVISAIALRHGETVYTDLNITRVSFAPLTEADIRDYWRTGEPADKAGAYAIQGRGAAFVTRIDGSYSSVVGLPLYELVQLLKKLDS